MEYSNNEKLALRVSKKTPFSKLDCRIIISKYLKEVVKALEKGENVSMHGLGRIVMQQNKSKVRFDMIHKKKVLIPARKSPKLIIQVIIRRRIIDKANNLNGVFSIPIEDEE